MGGSNGSGEYLRLPPRPPDGGVRIQKWGHPGFRNGDIQIQKWGSEMGTSRIKYEVIIQYYPVEHYSGCPERHSFKPQRRAVTALTTFAQDVASCQNGGA